MGRGTSAGSGVCESEDSGVESNRIAAPIIDQSVIMISIIKLLIVSFVICMLLRSLNTLFNAIVP